MSTDYAYGTSKQRWRPHVPPEARGPQPGLTTVRPPIGPIPETPEARADISALIAALALAFTTPADKDSPSDSRPHQSLRKWAA